MATSKHPLGYVIYDGPARYTRERILVIATGYGESSTNEKTGPMVQTWILTADECPIEAVRSGADVSICGDCAFRPLAAGDGPRCYVSTFRGPQAVWRTWARGRYLPTSPHAAGVIARESGKAIRIGAYGDPAMAPVRVWRDLAHAADGKITGYTHQWRRAPFLRDLCMASVNNERELHEAHSLGWRTFRVVAGTAELDRGEISCPASDEAGHRTTCARCGLCNGARTASDRRKSIAIIDHGPTARRR